MDMNNAEPRAFEAGRAAGRRVKIRARYRRFDERAITRDVRAAYARDCLTMGDLDWESYTYGYWCVAIASVDPEAN